jgi:hypothetical protein
VAPAEIPRAVPANTGVALLKYQGLYQQTNKGSINKISRAAPNMHQGPHSTDQQPQRQAQKDPRQAGATKNKQGKTPLVQQWQAQKMKWLAGKTHGRKKNINSPHLKILLAEIDQ